MMYTFYILLVTELLLLSFWTSDLAGNRQSLNLTLLVMGCFCASWIAIFVTLYQDKKYKVYETKSVSLMIVLQTLRISFALIALFFIWGSIVKDVGDTFLPFMVLIMAVPLSVILIFPILIIWYPIHWRHVTRYEAQALENGVEYPKLPIPRTLINSTLLVVVLSVCISLFVVTLGLI